VTDTAHRSRTPLARPGPRDPAGLDRDEPRRFPSRTAADEDALELARPSAGWVREPFYQELRVPLDGLDSP
jgi:hypothetical protein